MGRTWSDRCRKIIILDSTGVPADTVISGDQRLGRRVLESMAFLP
jgi:hypothetical protein